MRGFCNTSTPLKLDWISRRTTAYCTRSVSTTRLLGSPLVEVRGRSFSSASTLSRNDSVGFIGLGQMGSRMALNLAKGGKKLVVYDVVSESISQFEANSPSPVIVAKNPKEVAQQAATIITMLPSSPHVKSAFEDSQGILSGISAGSLCIDCSTIDPNTARSVAKRVQEKGSEIVDAPVSGGIGGAQNATLTFMVGGAADTFEKAKPILQLMGKNIVHCGGPGNGQVTKVCNNLLLGITMVGVSEAMNLGISLGMDPKTLASVINTSSGRCWSSEVYNPVPHVLPNCPSSNNYQGGFAVDLMAKDLGLAIEASKALRPSGKEEEAVPLGHLAWEIYKKISKEGYGKLDFSAIFKYLNENNKK